MEIENKTPIKHEIHMDASVANYWYDKFKSFVETDPEEFGDWTFAQYLGDQVLANMMRIFQGTVPQ